MVSNSQIRYRYINVVEPTEHRGELTLDGVERYTDGFTKPALFRRLAPIAETLSQRAFLDKIDPEKTLQWRVKTGDRPVASRHLNRAQLDVIEGRHVARLDIAYLRARGGNDVVIGHQ